MRMLGSNAISSLSAAAGLGTIPAGARVALIQPFTQAVNMRSDGTNPTATVGRRIAAAGSLEVTGDLAAVKLIEVTTSATAQVTFYG